MIANLASSGSGAAAYKLANQRHLSRVYRMAFASVGIVIIKAIIDNVVK